MPRKQQSERYAYKGELIRETEKAWLVALDEYQMEIWLPKSQCDWHPDGGEARGRGGTIFVPDWLAQEKDILP